MLRQPFEASRSTASPKPRSLRFFVIGNVAGAALLAHPETEDVDYGQDTRYEKCQEEPVSTHPKNGSRVVVVPRGALVDGEKAPGLFVVSMLQLALGLE